MQFEQRREQRVGQPARLPALPARLGDRAERGVGGGRERVAAQPLPHVAAEVDLAEIWADIAAKASEEIASRFVASIDQRAAFR